MANRVRSLTGGPQPLFRRLIDLSEVANQHSLGGDTMAKPSHIFSNVYQLSLQPDGTFTLVDSNPSTNLVNPVASAVSITDTDGSSIINQANSDLRVGNVFNGALDSGKYEFFATASGGDAQGFIMKDDATHSFYFVTNDIYDGSTTQPLAINLAGNEAICFMPGTLIATPDGLVAVEQLTLGQKVVTSTGGLSPVRWIGRQTVARLFADELQNPIRIKANAIDENVPSRDLFLSPGHALLVDGVLAQAGTLVNGTSILRETDVPAIFTYYHVELDDHSLILAENVPAETFIDHVDRSNFDNWNEHEALYPDGKHVPEMEYPRAKAYRQIPRAIHDRLAARGRTLLGEPGSIAA
jgi:hypothetical protein